MNKPPMPAGPLRREASRQVKDHRQIGQELDLFSFHDVAPGAVFWHPKGFTIYKELLKFIRSKTEDAGYEEVSTPIMVKSQLFKRSGHWQFFHEKGHHNMFNLIINDESWTLKPMNCPETTLIYSSKVRSYQDLPLKYSDYGILHRRELSGVVGGLFRLRQFSIDDAHLFARSDQIENEILKLLDLVKDLYKLLKFSPHFYLATKPDKAMGDPKLWKEAEEDLEKALKDSKVKYDLKPKDGAFYGPKIDIHIKDSQNRDWQLATIQLDFQMPESLELEYIEKDGKKKRPVIIHRAIFGSFERFIAILTEHFQGSFPLWISPVQVQTVPISDKHLVYAKKIAGELKEKGIRVEVDDRSETMQSKIREATLQRVPYIAIIGDKEIEAKSVSVRTREGKVLGNKKVSEFIKVLVDQIDKKI